MRILALHDSHNASICEINNNDIIYYQEAERIDKKKKSENWTFLFKKYQDEYFDKIIFVFTYNVKDETLIKVLKEILNKKNLKYKDLIIETGKHHFFHACSAFFNSGLKESYVLVADGHGAHIEKGTTTVSEIVSLYYFNKNKFKKIFKLWQSDKDEEVIGRDVYINTISLGQLFDCMKNLFKLKEAGSVMGYSSYGDKNLDNFSSLFFKKKFNHFQFVQAFFYEFLYINDKKKNGMFGLLVRAQRELEIIVLNYVKNIMKNKNRNLCVSGGVFMNTVLNSKILDICPNLYVDPFADDSGISMGAAQWHSNKNKFYGKKIKSLFLGDSPNYTRLSKKDGYNVTPKDVAKLISEKNIIGIYQGRNEMGKRALGNRSFLFDPRDHSAKEKINLLKGREWFRPAAGTVLHDKTNKWFDTKSKKETPYMSYVFKVKKTDIPGITHVDNTCRIQTLKKNQNFHFYNLIYEFYKITGVPILGNTSLNLANQPLVNDIEDLKNLYISHDFGVYLNFKYIYFPELNKIYDEDYFKKFKIGEIN
jgi:carbamoyltransferase